VRIGRTTAAGALAALALALGGCVHLGAQSVPTDRFAYSAAIGESWKQQTLLNIVKLRYVDLPVFVDVASIVSGYSMETTVNLGGGQTGSVNSFALGASGRYTDRPTITYVPLTGDKFLRGMLTPLDPKNIFFMIQAGYPADFLLALSVESINGVRNRAASAGGVREADPDFVRALELMRELQQAGGVGMRIIEGQDKKVPTTVLFIRRDDLPPDMKAKSEEVRRLFRLPPGQQSYELVYSPMRGAEGELTINSRSIFQILQTLASYVEAPEDAPARRTANISADPATAERIGSIVRIHSGDRPPAAVYASVRYRGHWFWIDDDDAATKRAVSAAILLFSLADTGTGERLPLITIPAQ
jgi:hypothetical protein